jgi:phosphopentomutase
MSRRAAIIVLDGVGIGEAPDAAAYGDIGSNTLANLARSVGGMTLPNLQRAGLGCIAPIAGVPPVPRPLAAHGMLAPASAGKDSTAGHWEIAGVHIANAFPTYPNGFPPQILAELARRTGRGILGNCAGSGTTIIASHGEEHQRTGAWIVYTSADSVFQIAAHEETVPLDELYHGCEIAREILVEPHDVSRVIARPFAGTPGSYERTKNRRDFSIQPPSTTLLDALAEAGIARTGVGKVDDLFAGRAISSRHSADNADGLAHILRWLRAADVPVVEAVSAGEAQGVGRSGGFLFANLVDFDQLYGHRNDVSGFYQALRQFDEALPGLLAAMEDDDLLFVTADHGNDPTTPSTDHARECVPLLVFGRRVRALSLGVRDTFSDVGATVADWFGLSFRGRGTSFLPEVTA